MCIVCARLLRSIIPFPVVAAPVLANNERTPVPHSGTSNEEDKLNFKRLSRFTLVKSTSREMNFVLVDSIESVRKTLDDKKTRSPSRNACRKTTFGV